MTLKQKCSLWNVWLTWLGLPLIAVIFGMIQSWAAGIFILIIGIAGQLFYLRYFPKMSKAMGYGSVEDQQLEKDPTLTLFSDEVIFYSTNVCPFCPIVRRRLQDLQTNLKFELNEVDVTFQPKLIKEKGFRSVPVIKYKGRHWVGNATTKEINDFLRKSTQS